MVVSYSVVWALGGRLRPCLLSALMFTMLSCLLCPSEGAALREVTVKGMSQSICVFNPVIPAVGLELSVTAVTGGLVSWQLLSQIQMLDMGPCV